jgi:hypothetical protein
MLEVEQEEAEDVDYITTYLRANGLNSKQQNILSKVFGPKRSLLDDDQVGYVEDGREYQKDCCNQEKC